MFYFDCEFVSNNYELLSRSYMNCNRLLILIRSYEINSNNSTGSEMYTLLLSNKTLKNALNLKV